MTSEERKVLDSLIETWNLFIKLPVEHRDDNDEFRHGLHDLQRIIMVREVRRKLK